jgi:pimeloyl-ACP methyl ester carboxylesterase
VAAVGTVRTARGRVQVQDSGGAEPAVLVVHGMPGDYRQGQTVDEDLGTRARVLRVSRPGYAGTPLSSGRTAEASADLYAALLDALDIPHAVVLGISGGGPSSYAFAQRHPDRCAGLVLCCALQASLKPVPPAMRRVAAVPGLLPLIARVVALKARVMPPQLQPQAFTLAERAQLDDPYIRDALLRFLRERPCGEGFRNDVQQREMAEAPAEWPSGSAVPVVVLHGDLDDVVPLSHALDYVERIPGARFEVLEGLGHAVPLFARKRVADLLLELSGPART